MADYFVKLIEDLKRKKANLDEIRENREQIFEPGLAELKAIVKEVVKPQHHELSLDEHYNVIMSCHQVLDDRGGHQQIGELLVAQALRHKEAKVAIGELTNTD
jgi:hypothetical protein